MSLSIIYYSACLLSDHFAHAVRAELVRSVAGRYPIISVTHAPIDFGDVRIVISNPVVSIAQVYRNLLAGCRMATSTFCAAAEDDTLYTRDHWDYRPPIDTFAYNEHRLVLTRRLSADGRRREALFYARTRTQMAMGIFPRALMVDALEEKFRQYPCPPLDTNVAKKAGWGEPGRYEKNLKLTRRKLTRFKWSAQPNVTINHGGLLGRRRINPDDVLSFDAEPWGNADALWKRIHG